MNPLASADPFAVLGVSSDAGEADVRARYLELVKQFPPEREPEKFREIRAAFEVAKDPLAIAKRLIAPPDDEVPKWADVLEAQKKNPPRMSTAFLLSLGNRAAGRSVEPSGASPDSEHVAKGPEQKGPEQKGPEQKGPEQKGPEQKGPEQKGPEQKGFEQKGLEQRPQPIVANREEAP